METTIKIGVSSCLLGNNVRYNGGHAHDRFITGTLGEFVEFVPVCPEVECGSGIPRLTMHQKGDVQNPRLVTTKTGEDHTERMVKWANKRLKELAGEDLCGFIFKKNSPSSGMTRVKVYVPLVVPLTLVRSNRVYIKMWLISVFRWLRPPPIALLRRILPWPRSIRTAAPPYFPTLLSHEPDPL